MPQRNRPLRGAQPSRLRRTRLRRTGLHRTGLRRTVVSPLQGRNAAAHRRRPWVSAVLLAAVGVIALGGRCEASPPAAVWSGSMSVTLDGPNVEGQGELQTLWELDVRWREGRRIPVRDTSGRITGEFVLLEDDGTTWTGTRSGHLEDRRECSLTVSRYEGRGSGGLAIEIGWIYFSHVAESALSPILEDGTYHVYSGTGAEPIEGTTTRTYRDTCRGGSSVDRRDAPSIPLVFSIGRQLLHPTAETREFSTEHLAALLIQSEKLLRPGGRFLDTEPRRTERSRMTGSYRSASDASSRSSWHVAWSLSRTLAPRTRIDPFDSSRPRPSSAPQLVTATLDGFAAPALVPPATKR